ncbi:hypothetical protein [Burkholderia pyrrocinia]|uniref:hypothetical protein n=1 Tax=Burkholderia pyrrocinia TaxID=60550 RepID=UPI002AB14032|nr:hypothetical protein [Burkholderia pyrrocinia]
MKITDDMLTEMEPIVSHWIRERGTCMDGASYAAALELAAYVAAHRTAHDRNGVIEECAIRAAIHSKYPIQNEFDRGYEQARLDAARSVRTLKTA